MIDAALLTSHIKESLYSEGFGPVGIAPVTEHPEDAAGVEAWVASGMHGSMSYLERYNDKRADIASLVLGARSVIVAGMNYYNNDLPDTNNTFFIARYARGRDYHTVIRDKLLSVLSVITSALPETTGRVFTDSAPVTEKAWAERAGLGWRGRNSLIINKESGSFFLLGEIVTTAQLIYDTPEINDHCGECRLCIDACPTGAINNNRTIDARRCISYHTIELRGEKPPKLLKEEAGRIIFGCDRCQEVCPWNKKAKHHSIPEFVPSDEKCSLTRDDWRNMTEERFNRLFAGSPLERAGYKGMMHNVALSSGGKTI